MHTIFQRATVLYVYVEFGIKSKEEKKKSMETNYVENTFKSVRDRKKNDCFELTVSF